MNHPRTRRGESRIWRLRAFWRKMKVYWTATGVIPRWQLVAVYLLISGVGIIGFVEIQNRQEENKATAQAAAELARNVQQERQAGIEATCDRSSSTVDILILGSNQDQLDAKTKQAAADVRRRRDVTLGLLASLRPVDCPRDPRLPVIPPRKPGPSPTPIPSSTP